MRTIRNIILCAGAAAIAAPAIAQPKFIGMGKPSGMPANYIPFVKGVTDDSTVFGQEYGPAFLWSPTGGYLPLPGLTPQAYGSVTSSSSSVNQIYFGCVVDIFGIALPAAWLSDTRPPKILEGFPSGWTCSHVSCNATGTVVIGSMQHLTTFQWGIFIWRAGQDPPMQFITEFPAGIAAASIQDLSHDGMIGFGGATNASASAFQGVRWRSPSTIDLLGDAPGGTMDAALGFCDWKGWRAAGRATPASNIDEAAFWDPKNGWVTLGVLKPEHCGAGLNMDDSGWFFAGSSGFCAGLATAITWTPLDGMRDLKEILVNDYGLTAAAAWNLWAVDALSPNGKYLAGRGVNPQGKIETWWAEIIPFCYADCDRNKALNVLDFICYSDHYVLDDLYANCNNDANLDIFDIICFSDAFAKGCP